MTEPNWMPPEKEFPGEGLIEVIDETYASTMEYLKARYGDISNVRVVKADEGTS